MAKNNINLGTLSGKLGDNVFWRTHGQQRVRTYFKRENMAVGYEAAERQSRFANLKSIYQWLPDDFKKACNLYKVGGNPYADFMRQYNEYGMGRDKDGFGVGRFLPVECSISNGTFNVQGETRFEFAEAYLASDPNPIIPAIIMPMNDGMDGTNDWAEFSVSLLKTNKNLREGDYMHILLAYVYWAVDTWGSADAVAGFPFAYSNPLHLRLRIDTQSNIDFSEQYDLGVTMCGGMFGENADRYYGGFGFHPNIIPPQEYDFLSIVGAIMFERPTNTRQQRYSPAKLRFNRSQLEILSPTMRSRWNDYAAQSYVKVL